MFAWPMTQPMVANGVTRERKTGSPYGMRKHPVTGEYKMHQGVDIGADVGTPVMAAGAGRIGTLVMNNPSAGTYIEIDHGDGHWTRYLHLSDVRTKVGDIVREGQVIGLSGGKPGAYGAGTSTGPHLHFEVWNGQPFRGGTSTDPVPFLTHEPGYSAAQSGMPWFVGLAMAGWLSYTIAVKRGKIRPIREWPSIIRRRIAQRRLR